MRSEINVVHVTRGVLHDSERSGVLETHHQVVSAFSFYGVTFLMPTIPERRLFW
jgi:hypothetical protein